MRTLLFLAASVLLLPVARAAASPVTNVQLGRLFAGGDSRAVWLCPDSETASELSLSFICDAAVRPGRRPSAYYSAAPAFWSGEHRHLHFLGRREGHDDLVFVREAPGAGGTLRWQLHADKDGRLLGARRVDDDGTRHAVRAEEAQALLDEEEAAWAARAGALP